MKRILPLLLVMLLVSSCALGEPKKERFQASYLTLFDTVTTVAGFEKDRETFSEKAVIIQKEMEEYHQLCDIYHSYDGINNLYTVNRNAGIAPVEVDEKIISLLERCKELYYATDGKVNVAMGSVLQIWHNYRTAGIDDPENAKLPPMDKLQEAAEHCSMDDVIIDREASTVFLADPEMRLDVGAVAKGYATEQVALSLAEQGFDGYTLSVGGNIRTIGLRGDGGNWNIGLQNPFAGEEGQDATLFTVAIGDGLSVVTSGSYQRYYTVDGKEYHHIIDPDTLMPENRWLAVTIIGSDSGVCDALSTALFNLEQEEGEALLKEFSAEAVWIAPDGTEIYSEGFTQYIKEDS